MYTTAQQANSRARVQILSSIDTWIVFDKYFNSNWILRGWRARLVDSDVYLPLVGEWAIFAFHELGKEEGTWKRERGEALKAANRLAIEGFNLTIDGYKPYTDLSPYAPGMSQTSEAFQQLTERAKREHETARRLLNRATNSAIFDPRRLGKNWNCLYLMLLQEHISFKTRWDSTSVITSIAHLVAAAYCALKRPCPDDLRVLLQKAIRHFKANPDNATLMNLIKNLVRDPDELNKEFPRVPIRNPALG